MSVTDVKIHKALNTKQMHTKIVVRIATVVTDGHNGSYGGGISATRFQLTSPQSRSVNKKNKIYYNLFQ